MATKHEHFVHKRVERPILRGMMLKLKRYWLETCRCGATRQSWIRVGQAVEHGEWMSP